MQTLEVRAATWKSTVLFGVVFAATQQVVYRHNRGHFEPIAVGVIAICVLGLSLFRWYRPYYLRIENGTLSGPARHGQRRAKIRLSDVDRERSAKPGFFGGRTIWSRSGEAIYLDPVVISREGRHRLLAALDLDNS